MSKIAFVTGASNVTGKNIALAFARAGYDVGFTYTSNEEGAKDTLKEIEALGQRGIYYYMNTRNVDESVATLKKFAEEFGPMDAMVNNTGITTTIDFLKVTQEDFDYLSEINIRGTYFMTQAAAKIMIKNNIKGAIVNIASVHAIGTFWGHTVYATTRAAVVRMTRSIALELSPYGINVNGFAPGYVDMSSAPKYDTPEKVAEIKAAYAETAKHFPLHRWQKPEEIGECVVFLCSKSAEFIQGQTMFAEGGVTIPMGTAPGWENLKTPIDEIEF